MTMTITELERSLRALRLSGMTATLENRALQVAQQQMDFIEAFSALVQDELDRRRSRLIERRFTLSGLTERKDLKDFDWSYNPKNPRREILELANLKFIDRTRGRAVHRIARRRQESHREGACAAWPCNAATRCSIARPTFSSMTSTRRANSASCRKYRATIKAADLVVIDDLFLRKLPPHAGDELADVIMSRYEKSSTLITSNREIDDWAKLLGDVVIVTPLLDRLMHHGHLLKFVGKSWRLKESAERLAKARQTA